VPFIAITEAVFTRLSDARVAETVQRLAGDLVEAVLAGDVGPRELRRRARAFGLSGARPMAFVALRPATPEAAPLARLAEAAGRFGPAGIRDGVVAVLIEAAGDAEAEQAASDLLRETGAGAAGVGRVRTEPAELSASFDESLYAVEARPVNGTPTVATFRDLGSIQLLLSLGDERGVELYCEAMLGPLRAHDDRYGSALIESLQAYIEANGRWADAAGELGVHRHTLRYRIRKVEQLTGRSPADARDRLELWLALRAHELRARRELEPVP
jgi:purine catabolism regulator